MITVYIVQHAEKERRPGDPSLSPRGRAQAKEAAMQFADAGITKVFASDLRRSRETAQILATELGLGQVYVDPRFRERMNLGMHDDVIDFAMAWERSTYDRDYVSLFGDSSRATAARFREALDHIADKQSRGAVIVVAHGGCTIDVLRDLVDDKELDRAAPGAILNGIRPCAVSELRWSDGAWQAVRIAGNGFDHS